MMYEPMGMIVFCRAGVVALVYPLVATKTSRAQSEPREVVTFQPRP